MMNKFFIVLKNGQPEKVIDDPVLKKQIESEYKSTQQTAIMVVANQISNVFQDEELCYICCRGLEKEFPEFKWSVGELHFVVSSVEWS